VKDSIEQLKELNHAWCCSECKCTCDKIKANDENDLGNRIMQEMWDKEKRYLSSKNKLNE
tara:strand:+ start:382 stop:561 length:180 start_codon:yes stop_codon:yes gene_type:complete